MLQVDASQALIDAIVTSSALLQKWRWISATEPGDDGMPLATGPTIFPPLFRISSQQSSPETPKDVPRPQRGHSCSMKLITI
jgi:hypothetical protein